MSLGNVLAVAYATQKEKLTFLEEEDKVTDTRGFLVALKSWSDLFMCGAPPPPRMHLLSGRDHPLRCRLDYMSCWDMEVASCLSR